MARWTATLAERFWSKVDTSGDCWLWTGSSYQKPNRGRYGQLWVGEFREKRGAHRVAWYLAHGEWPNVVDHVCRNTLCVRIDHLRDTTHADNIRVGNSPSAIAVRTGVCQNGHDDWKIIKATGKRRCRTCEADRGRRARARARNVL